MKKIVVAALVLALVGVAAAGALHVSRSIGNGVCPLTGEPVNGVCPLTGQPSAAAESSAAFTMNAVGAAESSEACPEAAGAMCASTAAAAQAKKSCAEKQDLDCCKQKMDCDNCLEEEAVECKKPAATEKP